MAGGLVRFAGDGQRSTSLITKLGTVLSDSTDIPRPSRSYNMHLSKRPAALDADSTLKGYLKPA